MGQMENNTITAADRWFTSQKYRVLSGSVLKMTALLCMLIDHSAAVILRQIDTANADLISIGSHGVSLYWICRMIGRLAFPIYSFLITEGYIHTHDKKKYGSSLLCFALISEIPWNLEHSGRLLYRSQNVFFTLFLGFLGIWALDRFRKEPWKASLLVLLLFGASVLAKADYGWKGFLFILLTWLLSEQPLMQLFAGIVLLPWWAGVALAYVPMSFYSGERGFIRGKAAKYACYVFYPAHLLVLWLLHRHFFGY